MSYALYAKFKWDISIELKESRLKIILMLRSKINKEIYKHIKRLTKPKKVLWKKNNRIDWLSGDLARKKGDKAQINSCKIKWVTSSDFINIKVILEDFNFIAVISKNVYINKRPRMPKKLSGKWHLLSISMSRSPNTSSHRILVLGSSTGQNTSLTRRGTRSTSVVGVGPPMANRSLQASGTRLLAYTHPSCAPEQRNLFPPCKQEKIFPNKATNPAQTVVAL